MHIFYPEKYIKKEIKAWKDIPWDEHTPYYIVYNA